MKTRILYVVSGASRPGTTKQLELLCQGLPQDRFELHVCASDRGTRALQVGDGRVSLTSVPRRWDPTLVWRLRRCIRNVAPDIVHTWSPVANSYGGWAAIWEGQRHLVASLRYAEHGKPGAQRVLDRWLAHRSQRIIVNSAGVRDYYVHHGWAADKFQVIPNGIGYPSPATGSRAERLTELGLPADAKLTGAVGPLYAGKRVKDLIYALDLLRVIRPDVHLLILGEGPHRWRLERYRDQCRMSDRVHLLGHRQDLSQILPHLACLWQASTCEGMPNAIMESMSAGVPVIATDISGNRDLVVDGRTGYLVPVGDRAAFARQTNLLLNDPALARQLGAAGRNRVHEKFSVDRMVRQYAALYHELMAS